MVSCKAKTMFSDRGSRCRDLKKNREEKSSPLSISSWALKLPKDDRALKNPEVIPAGRRQMVE